MDVHDQATIHCIVQPFCEKIIEGVIVESSFDSVGIEVKEELFRRLFSLNEFEKSLPCFSRKSGAQELSI
jgi:hypothetical protein